jgi:hypothetical protein
MDGRGVGVDSRWKERRRLDGGGSGAVVLRHGWGVRNGDFCLWMMAKCAGSSQIQTSVVGKKIFWSSKVI